MLQEYNGLYFDTVSGVVYNDMLEQLPFTFEFNPGYNPFHYATLLTANKVADFVKSLAPHAVVKVKFAETMGPAQLPKQALIVATFGESEAELVAGLIANSMMRSGMYWAKQLVALELTKAGISL
jgi:hypothetical protein